MTKKTKIFLIIFGTLAVSSLGYICYGLLKVTYLNNKVSTEQEVTDRINEVAAEYPDAEISTDPIDIYNAEEGVYAPTDSIDK